MFVLVPAYLTLSHDPVPGFHPPPWPYSSCPKVQVPSAQNDFPPALLIHGWLISILFIPAQISNSQ